MMRSIATALALVSLLGLAACGGGSGGGDTPPPATQPGTLRTIALQGDPAPDGAGDFLAFPVSTPLSCAAGSWGAFVADTTGDGQVAYVVEPDADLVPVFAQGDPAPGLGSGQIDGIGQVWIGDDGRLVAWIGVVGNAGGVSEGLVSALVDGGVVSEVEGLAYETMSTPVGDFEGFDSTYAFLRDDVFFFRAETKTATGLWKVDVDGTDLEKLVASGDAVPNGKTVIEVFAVGVGGNGSQYGFVAETTGLVDRDGVYTGEVGAALYGEVAVTGDPLSPPDTIGVIPYDQPLVVYPATVPTVLYKCTSNLGQDHLILGVPSQTDYLIAREGDTVPGTTAGRFGPLDWLNNGATASLPMFQAGLSGMGSITYAIYSLEALDFNTAQVSLLVRVFNGQQAPISGESFSSTLPGLSADGLVDVSTRGDLAFANVTNPSGETGLFWGVATSNTVFLTAGPDVDVPDTDTTFGSDSGYRSTTADRVILFRAPVDGVGSGIFRRGQ